MKNFILIYILLYANPLFAQIPNDLIPFRQGDKWGYCTQDKKMIVMPKFEEASLFARDSSVFDNQVYWYASVKLNGKYGVINEKGELFIPAQYPDLIYFRQGFCWLVNYGLEDKNADKMLIINYKNQKIFSSKKIPGMIREFNDGLLGISLIADNSNVGLLGFIDYQGKVVIPFQYEGNSPVSDYVFEYGRAALVKKNKMGIIDKNNKIIYPFIINNAVPNGHFFEKNGTAHIIMEDGSTLIIDAKGKLLRKEKSQYDTLIAIPNSPYFVQLKTSAGNSLASSSVVDKIKKPISKHTYTYISDFVNGKAIAQKNVQGESKYGIIDAQAQEVVPFIYNRIDAFGDELFYVEKQYGQCGFMNAKTLAIQIPLIYNMYKSHLLKNGLILMEKIVNNKSIYVFVNQKGEEVKILEGYDWVSNGFSNEIHLDNYFIVKKNNLYSVLDSDFMEIVPYYENIKAMEVGDENYLLVQKNGKFGVINLKNEILVPFEYYKIESYAIDFTKPTIFLAQKNDKDFHIKVPKNVGEKVVEYYEEE